MDVPGTEERVPRQTDAEINRRIRMETEARIAWFEQHPEGIAVRLDELEREWDIERMLEANASALAFTGTVLGLATGRQRWLLLPTVVAAFLFQHAVQGWCPPLPVLRRLGFRTAREIEQERHALKALRGDYSLIGKATDKVAEILRAVGIAR